MVDRRVEWANGDAILYSTSIHDNTARDFSKKTSGAASRRVRFLKQRRGYAEYLKI